MKYAPPRMQEFTDFDSGIIHSDPSLLTKLDREHAAEVLPRWINVKNKRCRLQARRALLMHLHGGECQLRQSEQCRGRIDDYHRVSGYYEFDHLHELETDPVSPFSGMKQFRISGNDCTNRAWDTVASHCLADTRLVCVPCHIDRTESSRSARAHGRPAA